MGGAVASVFKSKSNGCLMLKFTANQFRKFEDARMKQNIRTIRDVIARHPAYAHDAEAPSGAQVTAEEIAGFCSYFSIMQADNMHKIARAHVKFGGVAADTSMTAPLRRAKFSENERVRAYLYGLETKKRRLSLQHPPPAAAQGAPREGLGACDPEE